VSEGTVGFAKETSDTLLPSVSEGTVEFAKLTYDSLSPYVTENVSLLLQLSSSDFLTIGYVDNSSLSVALSSNDILYPRIDEGTVYFSKATIDTLLPQILESSEILGTISSGDTLDPYILDSSSVLGVISASDFLLPRVDEGAVAVAVALSANDELLPRVNEGIVSFAKITSDALNVTVLDSSSLLALISSADEILIAIDDNGALGGATLKNASDTIYIAFADESGDFEKATADALTIALAENTAFDTIDIAKSDNLLITFGLGRYLDDGTARVTRYRRMAKGKGIGIGIK
jgi:hypothetical protein